MPAAHLLRVPDRLRSVDAMIELEPVVRILGTPSIAGRSYRSASTRMVLSWLALHPDRPTRIDAIARVLWPQLSAGTAVRRVREAGRQLSADHPDHLLTQDGTLRLSVPADQLDHHIFQNLVGDPGSPRTRPQLDAALALWRGEPCPDLADVPQAGPMVTALVELHHRAVEEVFADRLRSAVDHDAADHDAADHQTADHPTVGHQAVDHHAVAELSAAVRRHPERERLWRQLAVALFLASRQREALDRIAEGRAELAAAGLRQSSLPDLATAILTGDEAAVRRFS